MTIITSCEYYIFLADDIGMNGCCSDQSAQGAVVVLLTILGIIIDSIARSLFYLLHHC